MEVASDDMWSAKGTGDVILPNSVDKMARLLDQVNIVISTCLKSKQNSGIFTYHLLECYSRIILYLFSIFILIGVKNDYIFSW